MQKLNQIYASLGLLCNRQENSLVNNLTRIPKRDSNAAMPHTTAGEAFATEQADLLFLPDDDGYRYLLVVVDAATRLTDAEPLKSKDSKAALKAVQTIFKRKVLKMPKRLEVDPGSEFKGDFRTYFDKYLQIMTKVAGRHRQQAVAEHKNYQIGTILNKRMLTEEVNNTSSRAAGWTSCPRSSSSSTSTSRTLCRP